MFVSEFNKNFKRNPYFCCNLKNEINEIKSKIMIIILFYSKQMFIGALSLTQVNYHFGGLFRMTYDQSILKILKFNEM